MIYHHHFLLHIFTFGLKRVVLHDSLFKMILIYLTPDIGAAHKLALAPSTFPLSQIPSVCLHLLNDIIQSQE